MSAPYDFVAGDTNAVVEGHFKRASDLQPYDLTGSTPKVRFWYGSGVPVEKPMTIEGDPVGGIARYRFDTGELVEGTLEVEAYVESAGRVITSLERRSYKVRPKLGD